MALHEGDIQKFLEADPPDRQEFRSDSGAVGRVWLDGVLVIYDINDVPIWLVTVLEAMDEDGNTNLDKPRQAV